MRSGFTLVELLVAITLLAILGTLTGVGLASLRKPDSSVLLRTLAEARTTAILSGRAVMWTGDGDTVRFAPDGSSSGGLIVTRDITVTVDPLSGTTRVAR